MPALIAALPAFASISSAIVTATGVSAATATALTTTAISLSLSAAVSFGASALQQRQATAQKRRSRLVGNTTNKATIRQAIVPRRRAYGRTMVGNVINFVEATPGPDAGGEGTLCVDNILCDGPVQAIDAVLYGEEELLYSSGGVVIEPERLSYYSAATQSRLPAMAVEVYSGSPGQVASPTLLVNFPGRWTSSHRLDRIAHIVARLNSVPPGDFGRVYPQGANPAFRAIVRGDQVWDPRLGTDPTTSRAWSRSPALAALHVLTARDVLGRPLWFGIDPLLIDQAAFAAAANRDDALITLANGYTRPRWACDGLFQADMEPRRLLEQVLDCADYRVFVNAAGLVTIRGGGAPFLPTVEIGPDEIVAVESAERGPSVWERVNEIRPVYTVPELRYEAADAAPVTDETAIAQVGGTVSEPLDLPFVGSHDQARHLGKIALAWLNAGWRLKLTCRLSALRAWDEEGVIVTLPELGIAAQSFRVVHRTLSADLTAVMLDLVAWDGTATAWGTNDWQAPEPLPPDTSDVRLIEAVRSVTLASVGTGGGTARLDLTWSSHGGRQGYIPVVLYRIQGSGAPFVRAIMPEGATSGSIPGVAVQVPQGTTYEATVVWLTQPNHHEGPAPATVTRLVLDNDQPPGPVTGASSTGLQVNWTAPTSTSFVSTVVLLDDNVVTTLPAAPGAAQTYTVAQAGTVKLRTLNARGEFAPASVVTLSVTS